jgi:hypothetical protein
MKRRLINFLTALSLLLCVAVVAMAVGNSNRMHVGANPQYAVGSDDHGNLEVCRSGSGCVRFPYWLLLLGTGLGPAIPFDAARKKHRLPTRNWPLRGLVVSVVGLVLGFLGWISSEKTGQAHTRPLLGTWLVVMGIVAVSAICVLLRRSYLAGERELWRRQGRCDACGYDLSGNESGRCPECGAATEAGR